MRLTPEEIARLPKGLYIRDKCDQCFKILAGCIRYNGTNDRVYCSNACYEEAEGPRGRIQTKRGKQMIEQQNPNSNADAATEKAPAADTQKQEKGGASNKMAGPSADKAMKKDKLKKKAKPVEDKNPPAPKKAPKEAKPEGKKDKSQKGETPKSSKKEAKPEKKAAKKEKKSSGSKNGNPYREGSSFASVFERLLSGKKFSSLDKLFDGIGAGDPSRVITHIIRRGDETNEFKVVKGEGGTYQMTKMPKGAAA